MAGFFSKKSPNDKGEERTKGHSQKSARQSTEHGSQADIMFLQRTVGNRAVQRLINNSSQPQTMDVGRLTKQVEGSKSMEGLGQTSAPTAQEPKLSPDKLGQATMGSWRASNELWYFNGEPHKEPLPTQVTLQADSKPSGTFLWSVTDGTEKVELIGGAESGANAVKVDDNRVGIKSQAGSDGADDVSVRVSHMTADGTPTGTYEGKLGVRTPVAAEKVSEQTTHYQVASQMAMNRPVPIEEEEEAAASPASLSSQPPAQPKRLKPLGTTHQADPTWGYSTFIEYRVLDDKGRPFRNFDVNEQWTTGVVNDHPKANWPRGAPGGIHVKHSSRFRDHIGGVGKGGVPAPQAPQKPLGTTKIQHWGQEWYIGSLTPGKGTKVQTNTLQKFQDHAEHHNIKSPP